MTTAQPFRSMRRSTQEIPIQREALLSFRRYALPLTFVIALIALFAVPRASAQNNPQDVKSTGTDLRALPAAAQAQISAALGRDQHAYHSQKEARGYRMGNPQHGFSTDFLSSGVSLRTGDGLWNLAFSGFGYGDRLNPARGIIPQADVNRVEYQRDALTEWYVNGPMGLEQGFTLSHPPSNVSHEPLTLAFLMSGNMIASLDSDNLGLSLQQNGATLIRYAGLRATDARGQDLPAWLEVAGKELRIRVNDGGAEYPLTIDPMAQAVELTDNVECTLGGACNGIAGVRFGTSASISGDGNTIVVGTPDTPVDGTNEVGAAYVFLKPLKGWGGCNVVGCYNYAAILVPSDPQYLEGFGTSVAISNDASTIVVGAPGYNIPGAAYVFVKAAAGWSASEPLTQTAKLTASDVPPPPDTAGENDLGFSVAINTNGSIIVAGAPTWVLNGNSEGGNIFDVGAAYMFQEPGSGWTTENEINRINAGTAYTYFGSSVSLSNTGLTMVAGAPGVNALYVYSPCEANTTWAICTSLLATLTASDAPAYAELGGAVAISGDGATIAGGASVCMQGGCGSASSLITGAVYVFAQPASGWTSATQTAKLTPSDGQLGDNLGYSVGITQNGSIIVAGALNSAVSGSDAGAAYVYVRSAGGWVSSTETAHVVASDGAAGAEFGYSAATNNDGTETIVGAPGKSQGSQTGQGAAYVFNGSAAPAASVSPSSLTFGNQTIYTTSASQSVTVTNTGSAPLVITGVSVTSQFTTTQNCLAASPIAAGENCVENVAFAPTVAGAATGTLTFTDNSGAVPGSIQQVQLSGTGIAAATSTTLTSSVNPSAWGEAVTFTATVTAAAGTPTGSVTFTDGGTPLGTVPLAGNTASLTLSTLNAATHSIVATYSGDANFNGSASLALSQVVKLATSATSLVSSVNPSYVNQAVTFTAKVVSQYGGAVTGNITFKQGTTVLTVVPLAGGQATYNTTYTAAGTFVITAVYSGDVNDVGSTSAAVHQIVKALPVPTTTVVTTSGSPSLINQPVTFTATISTTDGSIPNGETVTFYNGATELGTSVTAGGTASFTTSSLIVATHTIKATYAGDAMYKTSTGMVTQVVELYPTTTTLASGLNPSTYGQGVQLTATVTSAAPGGPTGTVKFMNGTTVLGTAALSGGVAILDTAKLPAGTLTITAAYSGDAQSGKSSGTTSQTVNQAATTTTVVSSVNPSNAGQAVKFTATISSPTTTPTGTATFMDGTTALSTVNLAGGKAIYSTTTLAAGVHDITVVYNGTVNITGSTSAILVQTVN